MDNSHLDNKYFIDKYVYNCPFCNRRNVSYFLRSGAIPFDWTPEKKCYIHLAVCDSCNHESMHLSFEEIPIYHENSFGEDKYRFRIAEGEELDNKFFYSVPTSFFSLDKRIPKILRELITESEGCLKSNFLTGASACARKIVYELASLQKAEGINYDERVKSLKKIRSDIEEDYFDTLLTVQQITSDKVHEQSYDGWQAKHLRLILSTLVELLNIIYVIPEIRKEKRKSILILKDEILEKKSNKQNP
jgi:transcription elongation factor Elf1